MLKKYYNKETKTLHIPHSFNEELIDNLPENLTHLIFGRQTPVRLAHPKIMNIFIIV
jgi:hypothetical protein